MPLQKKGSSFSSVVSAQDFQTGGWSILPKDLFVGELIGKGEFGGILFNCKNYNNIILKIEFVLACLFKV